MQFHRLPGSTPSTAAGRRLPPASSIFSASRPTGPCGRSGRTTWASSATARPRPASSLSRSLMITPLIPYVAIAAGDSHSVARRADGSIWSWGNNTSGQLGIASTDPRSAQSPWRIIPRYRRAAPPGTGSPSAPGGGILLPSRLTAPSLPGETTQRDNWVTAPLSAKNIPAPLLEPRIDTPAAIAFGNVALTVGPFTPQPLTIKNTGTADLVITSITKAGDRSQQVCLHSGQLCNSADPDSRQQLHRERHLYPGSSGASLSHFDYCFQRSP